MKKPLFSFIILFAFSCSTETLEPKDDVMQYLLANGFSRDVGSKIDGKSRKEVLTMAEAKAIVKELESITGSFSGNILNEDIVRSNGRASMITCEDVGNYYIYRAIDAGISGVDVYYSINSNGKIGDIFSASSGFTLAWSWDQLASSILNPTSKFCIHGRITYGVDLNGIPLGYQQAVALRVSLNGCAYSVTSHYGGTC